MLLILFTGYYITITFYSHAHIINGVTIVHSHFYLNGDVDSSAANPVNHQHSAAELTLISIISTFQIAAITIIFLVLVLFSKISRKKYYVRNKTLHWFDCWIKNPSLRGPPAHFLYTA